MKNEVVLVQTSVQGEAAYSFLLPKMPHFSYSEITTVKKKSMFFVSLYQW